MKEEMQPDEFDRALSEETGIVPSSGFVSGVMDAVRRETSAPPPIPFPWARALPGPAAGVLALLAIFMAFVKSASVFTESSRPASSVGIVDRLLPPLAYALDIANMSGIGWILLASLITLSCISLADAPGQMEVCSADGHARSSGTAGASPCRCPGSSGAR